MNGHRVGEFHDTIGTIVDVAGIDKQAFGLPDIKTVGATAIEVAILHNNHPSARHSNHAAIAITALSMTDDQIIHQAFLTINKAKTEGIAGINLNARIVGTANNKVLEVLQGQLMTVESFLTDDRGAFTWT